MWKYQDEGGQKGPECDPDTDYLIKIFGCTSPDS